TSINAIFSRFRKSAKIKYDHVPQTSEELVNWIVDAATHELRAMAEAGRFNKEAPILILNMPGFVIEDSQIILSGNFGEAGNSKGLLLDQSAPNHATPLQIDQLVRRELLRRSKELGISPQILDESWIFVSNDLRPLAADAAYTHLKEGESALLVFAGTGTGSG